MREKIAEGYNLEAVEAGNGTIRRIAETGCGQRAGRENGGQRSWSVEAGEQPGTRHRAAQCLFRLAGDSGIGCWLMAQPAEPPYTDPYVRWCDRESWRQPTYGDCVPSMFDNSGVQVPFTT